MDSIRIITNNVPRPVINGYELTEAERQQFDYIDWTAVHQGEASAEFFRYKGELYDLNDGFMYTGGLPADNPLREWDGYQSDSFFSGLVIRYMPDSNYEEIVVGTYLA